MLDFRQSIASSILDCVDSIGADLVANTYHHLVSQYASVMWAFAAIFMGFIFLQAMQGKKSFHDLMDTLFRVVIIMTLALNYQYFCLFIYDIFTKEPLVIIKAIMINGGNSDAVSISQALDNYLNLGLSCANTIFLMGSWSNLTYFLFALLVFLMTVLVTIFSVGLFVLSKCAMVILLALSPLFIFFALFDMTRGLFESYVRHLFTYALIPILTSIILMMLFSVMKFVIQFMGQFPKVSFMSIAPFLLMSGIQVYLLAQVFSNASALGSGFSLGGLVSTLRQARSNMGSVVRTATGGRASKGLLQSALSGVYKGAARMNRFRNP